MFIKMSRSILFVFNYSIMELASNKTPAIEQITEIIPLMVYDFLWFMIFCGFAKKYLLSAINCKNNVTKQKQCSDCWSHIAFYFFHLYHSFNGVNTWSRAPYYRYSFECKHCCQSQVNKYHSHSNPIFFEEAPFLQCFSPLFAQAFAMLNNSNICWADAQS